MFGNILGRTKEESTQDNESLEIESRVSKMNLTDMRAYIKDNIKDFYSCEDGLVAVMNKLLTKNEDSSKCYIEIDDMDSKKKKGFDLVISISEHKRVTVRAIEQIQEFIEFYKDVIEKFDTDNKQIYASKLKSAVETGIHTIEMMTEVNKKAKILD